MAASGRRSPAVSPYVFHFSNSPALDSDISQPRDEPHLLACRQLGRIQCREASLRTGLRLPDNVATALRRNCWRQRLSRQQDCHQFAVRPNAIAAAALRWEANTSAALVVAFLRGHQRNSLALVCSVALLSKSKLETLQTNGGPLCKRCARFV